MRSTKPKNWDWKAWVLIGAALVIIFLVVVVFIGYKKVKNHDAEIAARDVRIGTLTTERDQALQAAAYHEKNFDEALSKLTPKTYYIENKVIREQIPVDVRALSRDSLRERIKRFGTK